MGFTFGYKVDQEQNLAPSTVAVWKRVGGQWEIHMLAHPEEVPKENFSWDTY